MLQFQILEARELAHAPHVLIKSPSTSVTVKTETDSEHTFSTRLPQTEVRSLPVNKTSEVEMIIYDQGSGRSQPIGLIWLKIADIADKIRKGKLLCFYFWLNPVPRPMPPTFSSYNFFSRASQTIVNFNYESSYVILSYSKPRFTRKFCRL